MAVANVTPIPLSNGLTCHFASPLMRRTGENIVREIFTQRRYARPGFELRPTDVVVDIGANVGLFALWAAPQVSRVISVEPAPAAYDCLRVNVEANGLTNVTTVRAAAGRDGGTLDMVTSPGWEVLCHAEGMQQSALMRFFERALLKHYDVSGAVKFEVPQISLGRLFAEHQIDRVDYLKIDCEGGEYEILRHLDAADWARIDKVAMEFHELAEDHRHAELVSILRDNGFTVDVRKHPMRYRLYKLGEIWARRR